MKKLILTALMVVMLATPSMAEMEPDGLFWIDGTFWSGISLEQVGIPIPFGLGFHENTMYFCDSFTPNLACIDFTRASLGFHIDFFFVALFTLGMDDPMGNLRLNGFLIPFIGSGQGVGAFIVSDGTSTSLNATLTKTSDNWTPPGTKK
jgi:hypothetical protein